MIRRGAALIIVLLILVAMTLLGLPFLFSQTWGLAGARSMQAHQAAQIYLGTAERLGIALAIYANASTTRTTTSTDTSAQMHSALKLYLGDSMPTPVRDPIRNQPLSPIDPATTTNHVVIEPKAFGLNHGPFAAISVSIADESGMLDPNLLDAEGWADLLRELEIPDWDDNDVAIDWSRYPNDVADPDRIGELAQALESHRIRKGRFLRLDDLRLPTPQETSRRYNKVSEFRKRLNAAEVERLRPYLSFHNRGVGRRGLTDLGSVVASDKDLTVGVPASPGNPGQAAIIDTSTPPGSWFKAERFSVDLDEPILNHGTWVEAESAPSEELQVGVIRVTPNDGTSSRYQIDFPPDHIPARDSGVWLQVPPVLNVHQMSETVRKLPAYRWALKNPRSSPGSPSNGELPPIGSLIKSYGQITPPGDKPDLSWLYLRPRFVRNEGGNDIPRERQPLDLRSDGLVRIEAAATIFDAAGGQAAQRARTTIVQAIAQEDPIEYRWITQGQFEPLVGQRFTSRMTTWPKATGRATDIQPAAFSPTDRTAPANRTGLSFSILEGPANFSAGSNGPLMHLDLTWRAPLGSRNPGTSVDPDDEDYVLKDRRISNESSRTERREKPVEELSDLSAPDVNQGTNTGLYPDGVRIGPDTTLAYAFNRDGGPLRMSDPGTPPTAPPDPSLGSCHLGFWFKPETDWTIRGEPITLMEASSHPTQAGKYIGIGDVTISNAKYGSPADQNYFGVLYDPLQNALVACYTPPSASAIGDFGFRMQFDNSGTAWQDERCLPGPNWLTPRRFDPLCAEWSPVFQANRIFTMWKLGRRKDVTGIVANRPEVGRWYHLQVVIGNGRPGGIAIILDGITGTDVGLMKAQDYLTSRRDSSLQGPWPGDHLTLPSLLLTSSLSPVFKSRDNSSNLVAGAIEVTMPGFVAFKNDDYLNPGQGLTPRMFNPSQGSVLIGDEFIRYERISESGSGANRQYFLENCVRGERQATSAYEPDNPPVNDAYLSRTPTTETHTAGSRVIAAGYRLTPDGTDDLYRGATRLKEPFRFRNGDGRIIGNLTVTAESTPLPARFSMTNADDFSEKGYARLKIGDDWKEYVYFTRSGSEITIERGAASSTPEPKLQSRIPDGRTFLQSPTDDNVYPPPNPYMVPLRGILSLEVPAGSEVRLMQVSLRVEDDPGLLSLGFFQAPSGQFDDHLTGGASSSPDERAMFQIMDEEGRCEWVRYSDIIRRDEGEAYFIDRNGWNYDENSPRRSSRGQQRTPPRSDGDFPASSQVLPVQTGLQVDGRKSRLAHYGRLMSPGDLITFVPKNFSSAQKPVIAQVRYASNDGYAGTLRENNEAVNGFFALTAGFPSNFNPSSKNWEIVMGSGLNPLRDLSPVEPLELKPSSLPRLDAHAFESQSGRLVLGAADPTRPRIPTPVTPPSLISVDGFYAGNAQNSAARLVRAYSQTEPVRKIGPQKDLPLFIETDEPIFELRNDGGNHLFICHIGGETFACERLLDEDVAKVAEAIANIPDARKRLPGSPEPAPRPWVSSRRGHFAKLVGRALLGSRAPNTINGHGFTASPDLSQLNDKQKVAYGNLDRGPEILRLPIGPVRYLSEPEKLSDGRWFGVTDVTRTGNSTEISASASFVNKVLMITEPNRPLGLYPWQGAVELMQIADRENRKFLTAWIPNEQRIVDVLTGEPPPPEANAPATNPNYNRMVTSSWLRGLYNTPATTDWTQRQYIEGGRDALRPLVIGWWPRYASCLPSLKATNSAPLGDLTPQHLRSRLYPWIGMAVRLHGARFEDSEEKAAFALRLDPASNQCLLDQSGMRLEIRAMAGTINGSENVAGAFAGAPTGSPGIRGDWWSIAPKVLTPPAPPVTDPWQYVLNLYSWSEGRSPSTAQETDGVEVRMHFRYTGVTTTDLLEIARNGGRTPLIGGAKMRCYAPVSLVATDEAR